VARARRAKAQPARVVVPIVAAILLLTGVVGVQQGWFSRGGSEASSASPSVLASRQTAEPTGSTTSATPAPETPTAAPSTSTAEAPGGTSNPAAVRALEDCRSSVQAADGVLSAAKEGIGHWSEHVQAQTDANSGDISVDTMDGIFKRTRLSGPDDVQRYEGAVAAAASRPASCAVPEATPTTIATQLKACAARSQAQQPVLSAAKDAMGDWKSHLADMRRSRTGHVHNAQEVWLKAWRAAPKNIEAYDRAADGFNAPRC